jgi:hypothetical protein
MENVRKYCHVQWVVHEGKYTSSSAGSHTSIYSDYIPGKHFVHKIV